MVFPSRAWAPSPTVAKLLSWSISGRPSALARSTARKPSGCRLTGVSLQNSWATRGVRFDRTAAPDQLCRDGGCRSHCRGHVSLPSEHSYAGDRLDSQRAFPQRQTGRRERLSKGEIEDIFDLCNRTKNRRRCCGSEQMLALVWLIILFLPRSSEENLWACPHTTLFLGLLRTSGGPCRRGSPLRCETPWQISGLPCQTKKAGPEELAQE
jgi:hypothetical protein